MARREALLRLHKSLLGRRVDLLGKLAGELDNLRNFKNLDGTGDSADAAFDSGSEEMASQLAELDARELDQIERAIVRLKQGTYGQCEVCNARIPVGRLNVLPYSTLCINCQKEMERDPNWGQDRLINNWEKVYDAETPLEDQREVDLSDIEMDVGNR
ncbi:MAG TPA: TraR/DksA family transcriptional regulator [Gemmataceae bacterium]|jgi:DnaK suppressor protein|nr:TraR/DksA family transcriptional regulator [Gemmataceae bacterium]